MCFPESCYKSARNCNRIVTDPAEGAEVWFRGSCYKSSGNCNRLVTGSVTDPDPAAFRVKKSPAGAGCRGKGERDWA